MVFKSKGGFLSCRLSLSIPVHSFDLQSLFAHVLSHERRMAAHLWLSNSCKRRQSVFGKFPWGDSGKGWNLARV